MTIRIGAHLGPYEVLSPLGAGGMGEVYRARDTRLDREVAIKVLPSELSLDASRLRRFEKEARSASALNHPNIVTVYDIGSANGVSYLAMEKVEGETLRKLLLGGAIPTRKLLPIATQIAEGLAKAHEAGIVHRDLKPENLMVTKDGLVKILDFGLAKPTHVGSGSDEGSHLPTETGTSPGMIVGTVGYMSPEQASGELVDFRSDQFSFRSILYEMATGKRAFLKKTGAETLSAIINEEPAPMATVSPQAPAPLRWTVERCLAKDPEARYASTRDLARELATIGGHLSEASSGGTLAAAPRRRTGLNQVLAAAALLAASLLAGRMLWKEPPLSQPSFQRLTFRSGFVSAARFTPDGRTIVYSARWDGDPPRIFLTRPEAPESQRLDLPDASLVSLSSSGELAIITGRIQIDQGWFYVSGTLATAPLAGGAPREIAEDVRWADWSPDGKQMMVVRGDQLEFPVGKVIHRGHSFLSRFSPAGDLIAYLEEHRLHATDVSGHEMEVVSRAVSGWDVRSLAWSPSGDEIWFATDERGGGSTLRAVTLAGRERVLLRMPHGLTVEDVSRDGRMLLGVHRRRYEVWAGSAGEPRERNLTIFGSSNAMGLSADGKMLLDNENGGFYLRRSDGSPPKKLGEGFASELSADGKWAAVVRAGPPAQLVLVPTGAGQERLLERGTIEGYDRLYVRWSQDGRRLLFGAHEKGHGGRLYVQELAGGPPRAVTLEGVNAECASISPDGHFVVVQTGNDFWIYPTDGGERRPVAGFLPTDYIWRNWSEDGRFAYAWNIDELPFRVFRVELSTGRREPWKTITPQDPVGIWNADLMMTPDGKSYAYNCSRDLADLFLVTGVR
ncbi:MAG: protein kinase [Thermoanaerobaculia bacterium]